MLDAVSPDHWMIGYNAARHLFEQGHRRILTVTSLRRETFFRRMDGVKKAYRHFQMTFDPQQDLLVTEGFTPEEAEQTRCDWLETHPCDTWPDAILCASAGSAAGVPRALKRYSLAIPQDISLIATDFTQHLQKLSEKSLTCISVPCREPGIEAVHLLQNRLNRPQAPIFNLLLRGKLMQQSSVSCATRHAARVAQFD